MHRCTRLGAALWLLVFLFAPACPHPALGQDEPAPPAAGEADPLYASPRDTIHSFLLAMNDWRRARTQQARHEALDRAVACFGGRSPDPEADRRTAAHLYDLLNRAGLLRVELLPGRDDADRLIASEYTIVPASEDALRWSLPGHDALAEVIDPNSIALARQDDGSWRFSQATVLAASDMMRAVERADLAVLVGGGPIIATPSQWIRTHLVPPSLKQDTLLGLEYWQWVAIFVLILLGFALDLIVRQVLRVFWAHWTRRRASRPDEKLLRRAVRPFGLFAAALVWYLAFPLLGLPPAVLLIPLLAVRTFLMLATVWAGFRVTDLVSDFFQRKAERTRTRFDDLLVPLGRKTAKVFIGVMGVIYIAYSFDIEVLPLLTGLGIGGLAFAFAAKDTIENFFGSIAVIADRPFEVGDWVVIKDIEGTVATLGLRSTRIRTFYDSLVTVPNSELVRATVDNYGRRRYRRFRTFINITYDTPPDRIEAFCEGIREIIRTHPHTRKDFFHVWLNNFGAHSLDVLIHMFHETPDWATELRERHRFMLDIIRLADRLGVQFAFPTQTVHLYKEEHDREHTPADPPGPAAESDARALGARAVHEITAQAPWRTSQLQPITADTPDPPPENTLDAGES